MEQNTCSLKFEAIFMNTTSTHILINLLQTEDIIHLLCLNKEIKRWLYDNASIQNKIYYLTFLKQRGLFAYAVSDSLNYKTIQVQKVDTTLSSMESQYLGKIPIMKKIRQQLVYNFELIIQNSQSKDIVADIFETIVEPQIPFPNLRRETVGDYCNSSLQILMAQLNWRENSIIEEEGNYKSLQISLVQKHEELLEELRANKSTLLKIRFQSQLINSYESTNSAFLNVITLLLTLVDYHLESTKRYLQSYTCYAPFEFMSEFVKRYNIFRDVVMTLENKLGFLMELFTKAFNFLEPELEIYPGSSLWRCLIKKWVNKMQPFNNMAMNGFNQALLKIRENNFHIFLETNNKLENYSYQTNSKYLMKRTMDNKNCLIESQELQILEQEDRDAIDMILSWYVEYLVDVSSNQYSVHWCQSSIQKLSSIFNNNQRLVVQSTKSLYANWKWIFQSNQILKELFDRDIECLRNILKPNILSKIIQEANSILVQSLGSSKNLIEGGFQKIDSRIRSLNQKRGIPLQLQQEYKQFFDFDKTICLVKIQSVVQKARSQKYESFQSFQNSVFQKREMDEQV